MLTRTLWTLAALTPLGLTTLAVAQQPQAGAPPNYQPYQSPPSYQAPPPAYQQAPPAQNYQAPPSYQAPPAQNYQAPAPPSYQAPPAQNYQAPPSYSQPAPANQPPRNYLPAQNTAQAPAYPQTPSYQQAPSYPQAPAQAPAYQAPPAGQSTAPANYGAPAATYPPAAGYQQNPAAYAPPRQYTQQPAAPGYAPQGYQAPPGYAPSAAAPAAAAAGGVAVGAAAAGAYQQPGAYAPNSYQQGAAPYQQAPNYPAPPAQQGQQVSQQLFGTQATSGPVLAAPGAQPAASTTQAATDGLTEPYPKHEDTRFGHDRTYPNRGSVIRDPPHGALVVNYAGLSYRFYEGVWYEPRGPAFIVVEPPIGLVVPALPSFATPVTSGDTTYFYANSTFYHARPDLGGYEVVNDPSEAMPVTAAAPPTGGMPAAAAVAVPVVTTSAAMAAAPVAGAPVAPALSAPAGASRPPGTSFTVYPQRNQTSEEQARDYYECYRFANSQTGYDPMHPTVNSMRQSSYERAEAACFDARGYAVR